MFVICAICREGLSQTPPRARENLSNRICTITCGHIFHVSCINEWWRQCLQRVPKEIRPLMHYSCPICRKQMKEPLVFEVFPSDTSDDTEDVGKGNRSSENLSPPQLASRVAQLESAIASKQNEVNKLKTELKATENGDPMDEAE